MISILLKTVLSNACQNPGNKNFCIKDEYSRGELPSPLPLEIDMHFSIEVCKDYSFFFGWKGLQGVQFRSDIFGYSGSLSN